MTMLAFGTRKRRTEGRWLLAGVLMATTALIMAPKAEAAGQLWDPGQMYNSGMGLSADGRYAVFNGFPDDQAPFYWDGESLVRLGTLGGRGSAAFGLSGDGQVVVGWSQTSGGRSRAFRWTLADGMQDLGVLTPDGLGESYANGASFDGSRIVGASDIDNNNNARAFVWIEGADNGVSSNRQMFRLDGDAPGERSFAAAISAQGNHVVGASVTNVGGLAYTRAGRWDITSITETGDYSYLDLGTLGGSFSSASGVSADGRVVVGYSTVDNESFFNEAFVWREGSEGGGRMEGLGKLAGGRWSRADGVSSNGLYIVGASDLDGFSTAFRWSEASGMVSVAEWLAINEVSVGDSHLSEARAISDDGNVVIGEMYVPFNGGVQQRAYLARVGADEPGGGGNGGGSGIMDIAEYHATLYAAAGIANAGELLTWLPLNGAHHRPLMLTPSLSGDMCAWATGDFAHHGPSSTGLALAEIGACTDLAGGNVRIGGSVGTSGSWQELALGGSMRMQGQYVLSEIDWQPDGTPLLLSLTGMLGSYHANIDRAYSNGAATALSQGETNVTGGVVRLRADWLQAAVIGNTSINPYAALGFGGLHVNGYAESGGPFPAVFEAQNLGHADLRLGVTAVTEFSSSTRLSTTLEVAHRTGTGAAATGNVPGLFDFSLGGGSYSQTWARVGAELDHKISDSLSFSASAHLASAGRDPSLAVSAGLKGAF